MELVKKIYPIAFILLIVLAIFATYLRHNFISYLKQNYGKKWKELGGTNQFFNRSISNDFSVLKFLIKKEYLKLDDQQLSKLSIRLKAFSCFYILYLLAVITLFIVGLASYHR